MVVAIWQALNKQISEQQSINSDQQKPMKYCLPMFKDLKNGLEAVEEHARSDLGLIKQGETFVQMSTASSVYSTDVVTPTAHNTATSHP